MEKPLAVIVDDDPVLRVRMRADAHYAGYDCEVYDSAIVALVSLQDPNRERQPDLYAVDMSYDDDPTNTSAIPIFHHFIEQSVPGSRFAYVTGRLSPPDRKIIREAGEGAIALPKSHPEHDYIHLFFQGEELPPIPEDW